MPNLCTPRTNSEIWDNLNRGHQTVDVGTQRAQSMQVSALSVIIRIVDEISNDRAGPTEDHLIALMDAVRLMAMSHSSLNQVRKEAIRNAMGYPIARFCNWECVVGRETLFVDISKKIKDRDEAQWKLRRRNQFR